MRDENARRQVQQHRLLTTARRDTSTKLHSTMTVTCMVSTTMRVEVGRHDDRDEPTCSKRPSVMPVGVLDDHRQLIYSGIVRSHSAAAPGVRRFWLHPFRPYDPRMPTLRVGGVSRRHVTGPIRGAVHQGDRRAAPGSARAGTPNMSISTLRTVRRHHGYQSTRLAP